jgi:DNA primase
VDRVELRVNLIEVMRRAGVVLIRQKADGYKALCPFHSEKVPSFSVTPSKRLWHCFGCGAAGTPTQFIRRHFGLSSRAEAIEKIRAWGLWPESGEGDRGSPEPTADVDRPGSLTGDEDRGLSTDPKDGNGVTG